MNKLTCLLCILCFISMHPVKISGQSTAKTFTGSVVYINLMLPSGDSILLVDGTAAMYSRKFSCAVDKDDAFKLQNFGENISLLRAGNELAIEARGIPAIADTLFIHMTSIQYKLYALQIVPQNIPQLMPGKAWLVDKYLHTQTPVNLYNKTVYSFIPTSDTNSCSNRFMIVFHRMYRATPVPFSNQLNNNNVSEDLNQNNLFSKPGSVSIYPNPVVGNTINLKFDNMQKDNYALILTGNNGEILLKKNLQHSGGANNYSLITPAKINAGIYSLVITGLNTEKTIHLPIIINK